MVGRGPVDLDHVFTLAYHGAERALGTYSAMGLVSGLSMEFTSTSVAESLSVLRGPEGGRVACTGGRRIGGMVDQRLTGGHELVWWYFR